jgi:hypothetical protein
LQIGGIQLILIGNGGASHRAIGRRSSTFPIADRSASGLECRQFRFDATAPSTNYQRAARHHDSSGGSSSDDGGRDNSKNIPRPFRDLLLLLLLLLSLPPRRNLGVQCGMVLRMWGNLRRRKLARELRGT